MACALLVCAAAHAHVPVVVAFGDSTTAPRTVNSEPLATYCRVLRQQASKSGLRLKLVNAGVGGNTTQHARKRFDPEVLAHAPEVVIIQFGINDAAVDVWRDPPARAPRVALDAYGKNLRYFVDALRKRGASVVLMTPNPLRWTPKLKRLYGKPPYRPETPDGFNVVLKRYAEKVREIAEAEGTSLVDTARIFAKYGAQPGQSVDDLLLDGMHPNEKGHRLVAECLWRVLEPRLSAGE